MRIGHSNLDYFYPFGLGHNLTFLDWLSLFVKWECLKTNLALDKSSIDYSIKVTFVLHNTHYLNNLVISSVVSSSAKWVFQFYLFIVPSCFLALTIILIKISNFPSQTLRFIIKLFCILYSQLDSWLYEITNFISPVANTVSLSTEVQEMLAKRTNVKLVFQDCCQGRANWY